MSTASARFYPYGENKDAAAPNDQAKFATYTRDSESGLDYPMNRYYSSAWGRFGSADPFGDAWDLSDPQSWNSYAYTEGDPINYNDPLGLTKCSDAVDISNGKKFGDEILASDNQGLLGRVIFAESDNGADNGFQTQAYFDEKAAVADSIVARMDILNSLLSGT